MLAKVSDALPTREVSADRELRIGDPVPGDWKPTPQALAHYLAEHQVEMLEVHEITPWWLMQCKANSERMAKLSLRRAGYEAWYPTYAVWKPIPQRKIASHMRHKRKNELRKMVRPLYAGWVLLRPFAKGVPFHDPFRLYELDGCGGLAICTSHEAGTVPYVVQDYQVELMRRAEAQGAHDKFEGVSERLYLTGTIREDVRRSPVMTTRGKTVARLDESVRTSLFIEQGDRVIRIISSRDDAEAVGH